MNYVTPEKTSPDYVFQVDQQGTPARVGRHDLQREAECLSHNGVGSAQPAAAVNWTCHPGPRLPRCRGRAESTNEGVVQKQR